MRVLDNLATGRKANLKRVERRAELRIGDVRSERATLTAARGCAVVFHLAAMGSVPRSVAEPQYAHDVNATGTLNVLNAAREAGVGRVVLASTSAIYGDVAALPKREDLKPQPLSPYAVSKLAGEHYAKVYADLYGVDTVCLRYFNVYGPRQDPLSEYAAVVPRFFSAAIGGRRAVIYGDGGQTRDFTFVLDCVEGTIRAGTVGTLLRGVVLNIAGGRRTDLNRLHAIIRGLCGSRHEARHAPPRAGDIRHSLASIARAGRILGFRPHYGLADGLRETYPWYAARNGA